MNDERTDVMVREFAPGDEAAFQRLNEEWITRYFKLEPKDELAFANPQETILSKGGRIFFACVVLAVAKRCWGAARC
jgi:hypothetical protein